MSLFDSHQLITREMVRPRLVGAFLQSQNVRIKSQDLLVVDGFGDMVGVPMGWSLCRWFAFDHIVRYNI